MPEPTKSASAPLPPMPDMTMLETFPTHVIVQELQRRHRVLGAPFRQFVILGPPGAGKSTLSDHFRYNFGYNSLLPSEADAVSTSDEKMGKINQRLNTDNSKKGFVLDGFPTNVLEAKSLYDSMTTKRYEIERKTGKWAATETHKSESSGEFEKTAKLSQLDACILLDVKDVESLQGRLVGNQKAMTPDDLDSHKQDASLVAQYLEKTMNVQCKRIDASLPKDQIALMASKLVLKGDFEEGNAGVKDGPK